MMEEETAIREFIKYTEEFDLTNLNIERKQKHSLRVMEISKKIAISLNLNKEQIQIATLIGLLHDIARFKQYTEYETFNDKKSFDHGDYALEILDKDINKYIDTDQYNDIIRFAIKNHNKYQIEETQDEEKMLFAKIIRDADKIDIFYEAVTMFWNGAEKEIEESLIIDDAIKQFKNEKTIKRTEKDTYNDVNKIIVIIAFIYDINFKYSFQVLDSEKYIDKIINRFDFKNESTKEQIESIREIANNYIKEKIIKKNK